MRTTTPIPASILATCLAAPALAGPAPTLPPPPAKAPAAVRFPRLQPFSELRFNLLGEHLEGGEALPRVLFQVSRVRAGMDGELSPWFSSKLDIEAKQDFGTSPVSSVYDEGIVVAIPDSIEGWSLVVKDAWGQWDLGRFGRIRAGSQKKVFASRDWYDHDDTFYMSSPSGYKDLARRVGLLPSRALGVAWTLDYGRWGQAMLQLTNTASYTEDEPASGKDFLARAQFRPRDGLALSGSLMAGPRGNAEDPATLVAWAGDATFSWRSLRGLAEAIGSSQGDVDGLGLLLNAGADLPLGGRLDRLSLLGRADYWDPDRGQASDSRLAYAASADLYWDSPRRTVLMTGLTYEITAPENLDLPVEQQATVQLKLKSR